MPLLGDGEYKEPFSPDVLSSQSKTASTDGPPLPRKQSLHKTALMTVLGTPNTDDARTPEEQDIYGERDRRVAGPHVPDASSAPSHYIMKQGKRNGAALTDTPSTTAPSSPNIPPRRQDSNVTRARPTTLDIPGLTRSKVSPDGRIAQRDVGSKLVVVMVGLPARGKSYVTKKIARYLNWSQHNTRIFNVGERRRVAAAAHPALNLPNLHKQTIHESVRGIGIPTPSLNGSPEHVVTSDAKVVINGAPPPNQSQFEALPLPAITVTGGSSAQQSETNGPSSISQISGDTSQDTFFHGHEHQSTSSTKSHESPLSFNESMESQSADFFDPHNAKAAHIRDQLAMATLDELLDYILDQGGSVGIFDATNSTLERRKMVMKKVRDRAGPELGVLFLESLCIDESLLESNMRLKLSGPDYKDQDPVMALDDFKKRVALYQQSYVPLGDYEERNNVPYVSMIDVGRKIVSHQIRGFLSSQTVYYLLNFNLAPRQIWITRHGESVDNVNGKIGGDSDLSEVGQAYAKALTSFIRHERAGWETHQRDKALSTHFPPQPGDTTPPNPDYNHNGQFSDNACKSFCVWTSMLKRSVQTAQFFDEEDFDIKQMKMLDELNAGMMEGLTYEEIRTKHKAEYELRKSDKLHYRYPGAGGEGYLDIINRLKAVIVEVERMTDHVLLVGHRSVARVLLAYFKGLKREDVADLDVPLGMLYMLEPKPYGVDFKAYQYNPESQWFDLVPDYELRRAYHPN